MAGNRIDKTLDDFRQGLALIETRAKAILSQSEVLQREAEFLKIESFQHYLLKRRKEIARSRGFGTLARDRRRIRDGSLVALGSLVLGGLFTRDRFAALNAGILGFNGYLQGLGDAIWFVSFESEILVTPEDSLTAERTWLAWEDLMTAIEELKRRALKGRQLGNLNNITAILKSNLKSPYPVWKRKGKQPN
ncbi:MAG: hypothetical protein MUO92_01075 [Dehalococcoidales bacterium]|nr:hypothetical protein [Dehalococcoidales bacterium]